MIARNRDLGAGIIAERTGRAKAAGWLRSIPALLWRTERRLFAGWLIGAVVFAASWVVCSAALATFLKRIRFIVKY